MQFLKKNIWTLASLAVICLMAFTGDASAQAGQSQSVMQIAQTKGKNLFDSVRTIIFIVGGFGLVAIAFLAIFGKINWKWFAGLAVGLAILAAANAIVAYSTGNQQTFNSADPIGQSLNM